MMTQNWLISKVKQWPMAKLLPYARNARIHSEAQVGQIAASIKEFGFTNFRSLGRYCRLKSVYCWSALNRFLFPRRWGGHQFGQLRFGHRWGIQKRREPLHLFFVHREPHLIQAVLSHRQCFYLLRTGHESGL